MYSSSEVQCGTFNGKTLYRKIISRSFTTGEKGSFTIVHGISGSILMKSIDAVMTKAGNAYPIPYVESGAIKSYISMIGSNGIVFETPNTAWAGYTLFVSLEYAK